MTWELEGGKTLPFFPVPLRGSVLSFSNNINRSRFSCSLLKFFFGRLHTIFLLIDLTFCS